MKPVFAWAIRKPDGSLLVDHITGAPWLCSQRGHSASDCEVVILPRSVWETLNRRTMSDTTAVPAEPVLPDPAQSSLVPIQLAWANDMRIRVSIEPIMTDDGVLKTLLLRVGAKAGWMKDPNDMLLLSAEIVPMQLRLSREPVFFARHAIDTALAAVLDAVRQSYEPPELPSKLIVAPD